jgi:hypothetical protein
MIKKMQINLYEGKHKSNQKIDGKIFARASNRTRGEGLPLAPSEGRGEWKS